MVPSVSVRELVQTCSIIYMELTAQKEKVTREKGPAMAIELGTYALTQSFSHTSHGDRSLVPHCSYVLVTACYHHTAHSTNLKAQVLSVAG